MEQATHRSTFKRCEEITELSNASLWVVVELQDTVCVCWFCITCVFLVQFRGTTRLAKALTVHVAAPAGKSPRVRVHRRI